MKWNTIKYDIRDKNSYRNLVFWIQMSITEQFVKHSRLEFQIFHSFFVYVK